MERINTAINGVLEDYCKEKDIQPEDLMADVNAYAIGTIGVFYLIIINTIPIGSVLSINDTIHISSYSGGESHSESTDQES